MRCSPRARWCASPGCPSGPPSIASACSAEGELLVTLGASGASKVNLLVVVPAGRVPASRLAAVLPRVALPRVAGSPAASSDSSVLVLAILVSPPRVAERVLTAAETPGRAARPLHTGALALAERRTAVGAQSPARSPLPPRRWATPDGRCAQRLVEVLAERAGSPR